MSYLDVTLARKLVLENTDISPPSTSTSNESDRTTSHPSSKAPPPSLPSSGASSGSSGILKVVGNKSGRGRSPIRTPSLSASPPGERDGISPPPPYTSSNSVPIIPFPGEGPVSSRPIRSHRSVSLSVSSGRGNPVPSVPPSPVPPPPDRVHSVRLTRKIFNNWRSACGKTKDKTKDLFRRWKTLPENHPDFDELGLMNSSTENQPTPLFPKVKGLGRRQESQVEGQEDQHKTSTGWSVHIWATWVQRGPGEDDMNPEEPPPGRDFLSEFQKVKLTYFFRHVLDMNHDDVISAEDFVALNQRIRHYIEWSSESMEFHILKEVHSGFLEYFLNQPLDDCSHMFYSNPDRDTRENVNVEEWLDVWGCLLRKAKSLQSLPLWLQYFPKILFQVINKSGSGTISKEELRAFFTMFLGIDFRLVNETLDDIYNAMTDGGNWEINFGLYKLCFTNFLLAKFPHGPGQYLFGICSPQSLSSTFPIDYSALNTPPQLLEPYDPDKDKSNNNRRSVIV